MSKLPCVCKYCKNADPDRRNGDKIRCVRYSLWKRPNDSCCYYMYAHQMSKRLLDAVLFSTTLSGISDYTGEIERGSK